MDFRIIADKEFFGDPKEFAILSRYVYEAMIDANRRFIEANPDFPKLYDSGVVYDYSGTFEFVDCATTYFRGKGSCGHLTAWRIAELRNEGKKATIHLDPQGEMDGFFTYHVLIRLGDGSTEDPSVILGM